MISTFSFLSIDSELLGQS